MNLLDTLLTTIHLIGWVGLSILLVFSIIFVGVLIGVIHNEFH